MHTTQNTGQNTSRPDEAGKPKTRRGHSPIIYEKRYEILESKHMRTPPYNNNIYVGARARVSGILNLRRFSEI